MHCNAFSCVKKRKEASQQEQRELIKHFLEAKKVECQSWLDNDVYDLVDMRNRSRTLSQDGGKTVKRDKDGNFLKCTARWVLRCFEDRQKNNQQTDSPVASRSGFRCVSRQKALRSPSEAWANEAAWRVVLSFRATRYPSARRMVDGVMRTEWPFPPPEGRVARVSNLVSCGRVLTPAQAAVAAWPRARTRWYLVRREPLVLPGGTMHWSVLTLCVELPNRRRAQVVLTLVSLR